MHLGIVPSLHPYFLKNIRTISQSEMENEQYIYSLLVENKLF